MSKVKSDCSISSFCKWKWKSSSAVGEQTHNYGWVIWPFRLGGPGPSGPERSPSLFFLMQKSVWCCFTTEEEKTHSWGRKPGETDAGFGKWFHRSNLTLSQESSHSHWLRNTFSSSYMRSTYHDSDTTFGAQRSHYQSHDLFFVGEKNKLATYWL